MTDNQTITFSSLRPWMLRDLPALLGAIADTAQNAHLSRPFLSMYKGQVEFTLQLTLLDTHDDVVLWAIWEIVKAWANKRGYDLGCSWVTSGDYAGCVYKLPFLAQATAAAQTAQS